MHRAVAKASARAVVPRASPVAPRSVAPRSVDSQMAPSTRVAAGALVPTP